MYVAVITDHKGMTRKHMINTQTFEEAYKQARQTIKELNGAKTNYELILFPKVQEITEAGEQCIIAQPKKGRRKK